MESMVFGYASMESGGRYLWMISFPVTRRLRSPISVRQLRMNYGSYFLRSTPPVFYIYIHIAYSKLFGSYEQIELGYSCQAFRDLTGAPALDFNRKNETPEEGSRLFQIIYDNLAHKNIITTTSERNEQGMET